MNHFSFLYSPAAQALGYTLVYSLWQSFIVFICLRLILKSISNASARIKYAISCFAYLGIATWFIVTFFLRLSIGQSEHLSNQILQSEIFHQQISNHSSIISGGFSISFLHNYFPLLAFIYLIGIVWFSIRLMLNYFQTIQFRLNGLSDPDSKWLDRVWELADRMEIHKKVYAYISKNISTPMMVGFFRPIILLPVAAINNLSSDQIEAILLHELAHIRRNDYLFNLIQSILDTVLFFNPFAWWISKYIREEREKCCDEVVLKLSDPYPYARALLALEELGNNNHTLIMASVNNRSQLLNRIKNIMEMKNKHINFSRKLIALTMVIVATISVAWLTPNEKRVSNKNSELKNQDKTLFTVDKKTAPVIYQSNNKLLLSISDTNHPDVVAPLPPPPPPLPPVPPVVKNPKLPLPPVPPIAPVAPFPPSVSIAGPNDSIPSWKKYFNSDEWKKEQAEIQKSGEKIRQYFEGPEWKKQMEGIQKSTTSIQKYFNSDEWKKQQEEIQRGAACIQKYFNSPEWKEHLDGIQKNAKKMQQYFNSDEWKKQQEELKHAGDSIKAYFNSDGWKKQQADLQEAMGKAKKFFQSDEWKKQNEDFKKLMENTTQMMNNFKQKMK